MKKCMFWLNFAEICFSLAVIGSDNALAPYRRQAIIWTNDGLVYWCIYASLNLNELRPEQNGCHFADDIFKCNFLTVNLFL